MLVYLDSFKDYFLQSRYIYILGISGSTLYSHGVGVCTSFTLDRSTLKSLYNLSGYRLCSLINRVCHLKDFFNNNIYKRVLCLALSLLSISSSACPRTGPGCGVKISRGRRRSRSLQAQIYASITAILRLVFR